MDTAIKLAPSSLKASEEAKGVAAIACLATLLEESAQFLPPDAVQGLAHAILCVARRLEDSAPSASAQ